MIFFASISISLIEKITLNFNKAAEYKGKQHSYEFILYDNSRILADYVINDNKALSFNIPDLQLDRRDNSGLRNLILYMTAEERRRLGIRRNTLFYMKKNIQEGKKVKIYNKVMTKL